MSLPDRCYDCGGLRRPSAFEQAICRCGRRTYAGRFYGQAADIDSVCIIENCSASPGQFIQSKVTGTKDYDLIVEQISS